MILIWKRVTGDGESVKCLEKRSPKNKNPTYSLKETQVLNDISSKNLELYEYI